ncbi:MAG TPA: OB-fold nucleic acid binding domain-containing protein, partial [Phycisphaerae bacterium]|nr:OB-fold nucleic acid binding domain-containing protein [Phycisphaerae bacterium]
RRSVASSLRLGFRLIKGISPESVRGIEAARRDGPFRSVADVARRARVGRGTLARLAAADAFRSLGLDRRQALWDVLALREELPLLAGLEDRATPAPLPGMPIGEQVVADYDATGLSLAAHPISLVRELLNRLRVVPAARVQQSRHGVPVRVAGLVLVRQRPGTAGGIVFATLEDETGIVNLILRPAVYERCRAAAHGFAWLAEGRIERSNDVVHVQATRIEDLSDRLAGLRVSSRDFH